MLSNHLTKENISELAGVFDLFARFDLEDSKKRSIVSGPKLSCIYPQEGSGPEVKNRVKKQNPEEVVEKSSVKKPF